MTVHGSTNQLLNSPSVGHQTANRVVKAINILFATCMLVIVSNVAVALPILTPPGLNPEDTYRLAFVTSTT